MPTPRRELVTRFRSVVGEANCISDPTELRTYESDGLASFRVRPALVVLPDSSERVAACVRIAGEAGMPIVPRGSGTGLSGGALPTEDALVVGLSRMNRILDVDLPNLRMRVQPGVV